MRINGLRAGGNDGVAISLPHSPLRWPDYTVTVIMSAMLASGVVSRPSDTSAHALSLSLSSPGDSASRCSWQTRQHQRCCRYDARVHEEEPMHDDGIEDEQVNHWLDSLRGGTAAEKIMARNGLARVFERRGMLDDATELLE